MERIYQDLKELRKKVNNQAYEMRKDERVAKLQVQADWFCKEAMVLNKENKRLRDD
jgi:hypothetical protein